MRKDEGRKIRLAFTFAHTLKMGVFNNEPKEKGKGYIALL